MAKKKTRKESTRFHEYDKKIGNRHAVVLLSSNTKNLRMMKPHFFRGKRTADKKVEELKRMGLFAKAVPYKKSYVVYFD